MQHMTYFVLKADLAVTIGTFDEQKEKEAEMAQASATS